MLVAILPGVWCYVSGYPARHFVLCQWLYWQTPDVMSVAILSDIWCYVSFYSAKCFMLC